MILNLPTLRSLLALNFLAIATLSNAQNVVRQQVPSSLALRTVEVATNNHVYVGGRGGAFYKSVDGGFTWTSVQLRGIPSTDTLTVIRTFGADTVLVFTRRQQFLSTNGGNSFSSRNLPFGGEPSFISANNSRNMWLGTTREPSGLFRTTNGGITWDSVALRPKSICVWFGVSFPTQQVGYAVGGIFKTGLRSNAVFKTTNGGQTWDSLANFPQGVANVNQQWGAYFKNASTGFVVGAKDMLTSTTDGGQTWVELNRVDNSQPYLRAIVGIGDTILTLGDDGFGRNGYLTTNAFATRIDIPNSWAGTLSGNDRIVRNVAFRGGVGYGVAGGGAVLKVSPRPLVARQALEMNVLQVYPNPTSKNGILQVKTKTGSPQPVLRNLLGQVVPIVATELSSDQWQIKVPQLAPGLYRLGNQTVVVE